MLSKPNRRQTLALLAGLPALGPVARAQGQAAAAPAAPSGATLTIAVNEGVTYRVSDDEIRARYVGLSSDLAKLLGRPVRVEPVARYPELRQGLAARSYDLAFVHPAHLSIEALRGPGYRLVAVSKGFTDYRASFLVRADTSLKALADLRGRRLGAPDEDSITSWMVRATMRDVLGSPKSVQMTYTRYQDAVPFMVEHTFTHSGATASGAVVKAWTGAGGKVLDRSRPVPIKHVIAAPSLAGQVDRLRDYFAGLDGSEDGKRKLEPIKIAGYLPFEQAEMLALGQWLGIGQAG